MLRIIERFIAPIRGIASESDARTVLFQMAEAFGFRGAFLIEYAPGLSAARRLIDTDAARGARWDGLFRRAGLAPGVEAITAILATDGIVRLGPERFEPDHPYKGFALDNELGQTIAVPISQGGAIAGLVSYSGWPELSRQDETAVQLLSYMLFAELRARGEKLPSSVEPTLPPLTPREKEVMRLSAIGLTSVEIAGRLGMSPRTVNQHVDNVADKLGTKNRTHTIAELVRHEMLN